MPKYTASSPDANVISKGAFAQMIGVSAGRVSQYIAEGKISAAALVGDGRTARINVRVAKADLTRTLDISQRLGNGINTRLDQAEADSPAGQAKAPQVDPTVEDEIKREKLLAAQRANRRAAEDDALRAGQLVMADVARKEAAAVAGSMMQTFEGSITDMAAAVSAQFRLPHRDVLHCMRLAFTKARRRASGNAREEAAAMPATMDAVIDQGVALQ